MRLVNLPTQRDLDWNLKEIDQDYRAGRLTREEARKHRDKLVTNFRSRENIKQLKMAEDSQPYPKRRFKLLDG